MEADKIIVYLSTMSQELFKWNMGYTVFLKQKRGICW
jgi:hypothetical protein